MPLPRVSSAVYTCCMYTFLVDETNKNFESGNFFIVGGLVLRPDQVDAVDASVRKHAAEAGFRPGDSFKFSTSERPQHITPQQHSIAKAGVVSDLRTIGVRMIAAVIMHDIAQSKGYETQMNYSLNTVARAFHKLLCAENATGMMFIDRDNDRYDHLETLFQTGLEFQGGSNKVLNDRIRMFGMTSDNASNLSSAADIALGSFRYCVNVAAGKGKEDVARQIFSDLSRIFWGAVDNTGNLMIRDYGYHPQPRIESVRNINHKQRYEDLSMSLAQFSIQPMEAK